MKKSFSKDIILNTLVFVFLAIMWAFSFYILYLKQNILAENFKNTSTYEIFALPVITTILVFIIIIVSQYPHRLNIPWKIPIEKVETVYKKASTFVRLINLLMVVFMLLIQFFLFYSLINTNFNTRLYASILMFISVILIPFLIVFYFTGRNKFL